jgi:predicted ATPase
MPLVVSQVHAVGYRSLRAIRFPLGRLSVFVGANGAGKTNLYRALQLLQASAAGTLSHELAAEGGMESALWAGTRKKHEPAHISLVGRFAPPTEGGTASDDSFTYQVTVGLAPPKDSAAFQLEPQVKEETLAFHHGARPVKLLERKGRHVVARDDRGLRVDVGVEPMASETALGSIAEPERFSIGASITFYGPTAIRPCDGHAWPSLLQLYLQTARTWRQCSRRWSTFDRTLKACGR